MFIGLSINGEKYFSATKAWLNSFILFQRMSEDHLGNDTTQVTHFLERKILLRLWFEAVYLVLVEVLFIFFLKIPQKRQMFIWAYWRKSFIVVIIFSMMARQRTELNV